MPNILTLYGDRILNPFVTRVSCIPSWAPVILTSHVVRCTSISSKLTSGQNDIAWLTVLSDLDKEPVHMANIKFSTKKIETFRTKIESHIM